MARKEKTREDLLKELNSLQSKVNELETAQSVYRQEARSAKVFRSIADKANYGVSISDLDGNLVYVNDAFANMHGYSPEEVIGENLKIFYDKEQLKTIAKINTALKKKGSYSQKEVWHKKKDGTVFPTTMNATVIRNEHGKPLFLSATALDITEQKISEEALKSSEERHRTLFESSAEGIVCLNTGTAEFLYVNPAICRMLGYSENELKGKHVRDIHPKENIEKTMALFESAVKGEVKGAQNIPCVRKDGKVIYTDISTSTDIIVDGRKCMVGFFKDVTRDKGLTEVLQRSEERYRTLVESANNAIFKMDKDGTLLFVNKYGAGLLGGKPADFTMKSMRDLFPKDIAEQQMNYVTKTIREGERLSTEIKSEIKGKEWWFEVSIQPLKNREGEFDSVIAIASDITERRHMEMKLKESEEKMRSLVESAPDIILTIDRDGIIQFINRTIPGLKVNEVAGKNHLDYIEPEYRETASKAIEEVFKTGKIASYEIRGAGPNGSKAWYSTQIGPIKCDKKILALTLFVTDITERKKALETLSESESKFRQVVSASTDAIMLFDAETKRFLEVNKACEDLYGYSREEFLKIKHSDITAEPEESERSFKDAIEKGSGTIPIRYHKKKTGATFPVEISGSVFELQGRKVLCGVVRDITKRRTAEQKLEEQRKLLDRTNKELHKRLEELQDAMSHIKRLEGLVPICARCKKIRVDTKDTEAWVSLEKYISDKTEASLTHGLCPDCAQTLYRKKEK